MQRSKTICAAMFAAGPAAAHLSKLTVNGTFLTGSDGGNDLIDVSNVGGTYVHSYAPGTFFETAGSLVGKAITFTMIYDPDAIATPVGVAGVFDDPLGDWALSIKTRLSIGGCGPRHCHPAAGRPDAARRRGDADARQWHARQSGG